MKNLILVFALAVCSTAFSQKIQQQKATMSLGPQPAYYVEVEGADKDLLEDAWKAYIKEFGKPSYNKKAKEFVSEKVIVSLINGSTPMTLYARLEEGKDLSTIYLWVDLGGAFANGSEHATQSKGVETFLWDFWVSARKKVISLELEKEEKILKDQNKDLSKLENKNKDYHSDIEKYKMKIIEAEKNIETNVKDQEAKRKEIEMQQKAVQAVVARLNSVGKS
ncbi:MAG: hypothetical protein IPN29_04630 [Saprospiraceae bacterium]|nr:hypothetical protein [Saprospiraceae bacterium]